MSFGGYVEENANTDIEFGGWPVLKTSEFRLMRRIPSLFDESSIITALQAASLYVQGELDELLVGSEAPDFDTRKASVYKRAVYGTAHADLLPEFATQDRRDAAENTAEDDFKQADRFRAQAKRDISLLLGRSANKVDLI